MASVLPKNIEYPESDGRPMGETDLHRRWMIYILDMLAWHFRDEKVYVTGDILLYYVEGDIKRFIVPDAFFVKGRPSGDRRVYKLWEEGVPNAVIETTSKKTKKNDMVVKFELFEQLGVKEYALYDPTGDYLKPRLRVYRLKRGKYEMVEADKRGRTPLREAGWELALDAQGGLLVFDVVSGERVLPAHERAQAERERADREAATRAKLEAELARLKRRLGE